MGRMGWENKKFGDEIYNPRASSAGMSMNATGCLLEGEEEGRNKYIHTSIKPPTRVSPTQAEYSKKF